LAAGVEWPQKFVGLHFFSPVEKMKLVEIITGAETSDETLAKVFDFVLKIRKTPIVVNDSRGFYTSRVFGTYLREGLALLGEGQQPRAIEAAGLQAGMPVGPLALADEVSLGLMRHIREQTRQDLAAEGKPVPGHPSDGVLDVLTEGYGRFGKARGAGFYDYPEGGKKHLWPGLRTLFPAPGRSAVPGRDDRAADVCAGAGNGALPGRKRGHQRRRRQHRVDFWLGFCPV
jgi:3-hydroxyacyl-CoA dehydrogenase/enoyl-CoA hydratase/3-hydroxybutyryl-CoA epimerase